MTQVNGTKIPQFLVIPALMFVFWLGGLSLKVSVMADEQEQHESKPMHPKAVADVATIKSDVAHNKEAIEDIKKELKEQRRKAEADKQEILKAIREE